MKLTLRSLFLISTVVLVSSLAACASKVPLTEGVSVEDKSPKPVDNSQTLGAGNINTNANPLGQRGVEPVNAVANNAVANGGVVYFDFDASTIKPEFQALIEAQAKRLASNRALKTSLAGHTDESGGREYNLALGQKRAEAVKRALSILGAQEAQLEAVSFGKEKPAVAGNTDAAGAKNRRVEMVNIVDGVVR